MEGKTFITKFKGVDIYVLENGKFQAAFKGVEIVRASLSTVKKEIEKRSGGLSVSRIEQSMKRRVDVEIVGFQGWKARLSNGELDHPYNANYYCGLTDHQKAQVDSLIEEERDLEERWQFLMDSLKENQVSGYNFEQKRSQQGAGE